ncbi:MAG: hypothetical protein ACD_34C00115G0002, partial [uncultured bacterium]
MSADCHDCGNKQSIKHLAVKGSPLIALAGQPNVGKSTIFNLLTGLNQHVGNWPGKTVERKEGKFKVSGREYRLVDLPGTYSLTANSPEELITREFILTEKPDLVVALVNAANLERSLYLVAELVTLPAPLIVVLNMMDVASQQGFNIEANVLEAALGVPVVPLTATHAASTAALVGVIEKMVTSDIVQTPRMPEIRADHQVILEKMLTLINDFVPEQYPANWVAIKLLEGDKEITKLMQSIVPLQKWSDVHA